MRSHFIVLFLLVFISSVSFAQQKYALVIGNSNYTGISRLANPVNDANDMEAALRSLGFSVDKVLNGNLEQMETGIDNLRRRLSASRDAYGFFFFAGHGVQSGGENYLIPVTADNIRTESHLRTRAVSLDFLLGSLSDARNELNMVVLDACRDNPFGWSRSGSRGLSLATQAPSGTIVMFAAGAGQTASDGSGRNGLFTTHLLTNLKNQSLSVFDIFDRTMSTVIGVTNGSQHPELSLRAGGTSGIFLGTRPAPAAAQVVSPAPAPAATLAIPAPAPIAAVQPASVPAPAPTRHDPTRLVDANNPNALAAAGQSELIINAANAEKDVAVWVNGIIVAHIRPGIQEKIIVSNGQNTVEVADTTLRRGQWSTGSRQRLVINSNSNRTVIGLSLRYGALIGINIQGGSALGY